MSQDFRQAMRAAAQVMRSTADRFDALLARDDLDDEQLEQALASDVEDLYAAMGTLARELGRDDPGES